MAFFGKIFRINAMNFIKESTIHGLKELQETRWRIRMLWTLFLILALAGMLYQVTSTVLWFQNEPTVSKVDITVITSIPSLLWCPAVWTNERKLLKVGLTVETFEMFIRLALPSYVKRYMADTVVGAEAELTNFQFTKIAQRNNWTSIDSVLNSIRFTPEEVIQDVENRSSFIPVNTMFGPCYLDGTTSAKRLDEKDLENTVAAVNILMRNLLVTNHYFSWFMNASDAVNQLFVGDEAHQSFPNDGADIRIGYDYNVKLEASRVSQVSSKHHPCLSILSRDQLDVSACEAKCACDPCAFYIPGQISNLPGVSCQRSETFIRIMQEEFTRKCKHLCPRGCEQWSYSYYANIRRPSETPRNSIITLRFANALSSWSMVERPVATWDALFASIGGLVSLWCGASVLSVAQIIYYCCLKKCPWSNSKIADNFKIHPNNVHPV